MIDLRSSLGALAAVCMFNACSKDSDKDVHAPLFIGDSFVVEKESSVKKNHLIGIKRSSLEKEFLLQGELIQQPIVPKFNNLKSRIVMFSEKNDQINMMEAIDGHTSSSSLPQNILLAQFKIMKEENGILFFDFSEGMSKIFVSSDWYASDSKGSSYKAENSWKIAELANNFIESAEADKDNNLVIRQIAQVKADSKQGSSQMPIEARYYLTPYFKNKGFEARVSPGMKNVGFFEISPRLLMGGGEQTLVTRWDERKTIIYSISSNTPKEYIQAITDGVLYWNKAFGKDVLKVVMAPEGVTAPDFHYNIIQWVDWKDAGFAYADAQMDPRTGEILHSSIFLTSVFAFGAKNKAHQILRKLNFEKSKTKKLTGSTELSLEGFQQGHLCDYDIGEDLTAIISSVLNEIEIGKTDETALLKIAQDTLRETVAHEVGHTLGLRHNFAGSLSSNIPNGERDTVFKNYLASGKASDTLTPTSSVMDYQLFQDSLITGDQIATWNKALEYDTKAIRQLYYNETPKDMPLFCTDSQIGMYIDCAPFDYGPSVFEFIKSSEQKSFEALPYILMESFIAEKSVAPGHIAKPLSKALPNSVSFAVKAMMPRHTLLQALSEDAYFLKAQRGTSGDDNTVYLIDEIQKAGGLNALLSPSRIDEINRAEAVFLELLNNDVYTRSEGLGGEYEFTAKDKDVMKRAARLFFSNLPNAIAPAELLIYKQPIRFRIEPFGNELANIFAQKAQYILESSMGHISAEVLAPDGSKVKIDAPRFFFSDASRKEAAAILNDRSDDLIWGYKAKVTMRNHLKAIMDNAFQHHDFSTIAIEGLPDELGTWVLTNRQILDILKTSKDKDGT